MDLTFSRQGHENVITKGVDRCIAPETTHIPTGWIEGVVTEHVLVGRCT
ncbi:hypothetical protein BN2537_4429 [Streptomyces venezuelae]|nr:hypothetical protein BN2537_4429 [Streptomyces venezuelae]